MLTEDLSISFLELSKIPKKLYRMNIWHQISLFCNVLASGIDSLCDEFPQAAPTFVYVYYLQELTWPSIFY